MTRYHEIPSHDDYWKLEDYPNLSKKAMLEMLEERRYYVGSHTDKDTLRRCLQRSDRGMLSYVNRSNDELRELIRARGIETDYGAGNKGRRDELIYLLEHEDAHPRFAKFTSLPPELRTRIYEYHFSEFKQPLLNPKQPPLTLTCSLIRKEALPIFYASCSFEFKLLWFTRERRPRHLLMPTNTALWLHSTRAENLADMNKIAVRLGATLLSFNIEHSKAEGRTKFSFYQASRSMKAAALRKKIEALIRQIEKRKGGWKLEKEDFFEMRRAIETSLV